MQRAADAGRESDYGEAPSTNKVCYKFRKRDVSALLGPVAAECVLRTAEEFPLLLRQWFARQKNRATRTAVREYVSARVTPQLVEAEMELMATTTSIPSTHADEHSNSTMAIRGSKVGRSITARYSSDDNECTLETRLQLPKDYPLNHIEVRIICCPLAQQLIDNRPSLLTRPVSWCCCRCPCPISRGFQMIHGAGGELFRCAGSCPIKTGRSQTRSPCSNRTWIAIWRA